MRGFRSLFGVIIWSLDILSRFRSLDSLRGFRSLDISIIILEFRYSE